MLSKPMKTPFNAVLLIDDDEATNFLNQMLLEDAGCALRIDVAEGGRQALNFLTAANSGNLAAATDFPDLILLDINMPAMDGWEFLDNCLLLFETAFANSRVIMLTTSANQADRERAETYAIVNGFETKPLTHAIIEQIVQQHRAAILEKAPDTVAVTIT